MQRPPDSPVNQRVRTVRRRITAAVLATFVTAWLAVAALGKGGATSTTSTTSAAPSTGTSSQRDDGEGYGPAAGDDGDGYGPAAGDDGTGYGPDSTQGSGDSSPSQGTQGPPVTTSQS